MKKKMDLSKLLEFLSKRGNTQAKAARAFGVSRQAVSYALKERSSSSPKIIALEKADELVKYQFNLMEQYKRNMESLNRHKDGLEKYIYEGDKTVFAAMQRKVETKSLEQEGGSIDPDSEKDKEKAKQKGRGRKSKAEQRIENFEFMSDPHGLLNQVRSEIRKHMELHVNVFLACADPRIMIGMLNKIINIMRRVDPDVRREIEEECRRDELIRSVVSFDPTPEDDMRGQDGKEPKLPS